MTTYRIIITNTDNEIIHEETVEVMRYRQAEKTAIKTCKEFNGKHWHIKNVK